MKLFNQNHKNTFILFSRKTLNSIYIVNEFSTRLWQEIVNLPHTAKQW